MLMTAIRKRLVDQSCTVPDYKRQPRLLTYEERLLRVEEDRFDALGNLKIFGVELLMAFVSWLSLRDRLKLRQCCHRLREIVRATPLPLFRSVNSIAPLRALAKHRVFSCIETLELAPWQHYGTLLFRLDADLRRQVRTLRLLIEGQMFGIGPECVAANTDFELESGSFLTLEPSRYFGSNARRLPFENVHTLYLILQFRFKSPQEVISISHFPCLCPSATKIIIANSKTQIPDFGNRKAATYGPHDSRTWPMFNWRHDCLCNGIATRKVEELLCSDHVAKQLICPLHPHHLTPFFLLVRPPPEAAALEAAVDQLAT